MITLENSKMFTSYTVTFRKEIISELYDDPHIFTKQSRLPSDFCNFLIFLNLELEIAIFS